MSRDIELLREAKEIMQMPVTPANQLATKQNLDLALERAYPKRFLQRLHIGINPYEFETTKEAARDYKVSNNKTKRIKKRK